MGALVVAPLLVHRARVPVAVARRLELGEAVRARVLALGLLALSHHDSSAATADARALSRFVKDRFSGLAVNERERSDGSLRVYFQSALSLCKWTTSMCFFRVLALPNATPLQ